MIRVTVWNKVYHETIQWREIRAIYPQGIHRAIADFWGEWRYDCQDGRHGWSENGVLPMKFWESTDVLLWWSHVCHERRSVISWRRKWKNRVFERNGFHTALHSSHMCKPFRLLMGTGCTLKWREGDKGTLMVLQSWPSDCGGIPEVYVGAGRNVRKHFDIPTPTMSYISAGLRGEVIRSGCTFTRGLW